MTSSWARAALYTAGVRLPAGVSCLASTPFGPYSLIHASGTSVSASTWRDLPDALRRLMAMTGDLGEQLAASLAARGIEA